MSKVSDLCDELVAWLSERDYAISYVCERANVWTNALESNADVRLVVVPQEIETTVLTRDSIQRIYNVSLVLSQRMTSGLDLDQQDALMDLLETIEADIVREPMGEFRLVDYGGGSRTTIEAEALSVNRQFVAVLSLRYMGT